LLSFLGRSLSENVNKIVRVVKNLPTILGDVDQRLKVFAVEIFNMAGSTVVEEIKNILQTVRNFIDGIKQNVLKFYNVSNHVYTCIHVFTIRTIIKCIFSGYIKKYLQTR
jgi:phage-related protein